MVCVCVRAHGLLSTCMSGVYVCACVSVCAFVHVQCVCSCARVCSCVCMYIQVYPCARVCLHVGVGSS